MERDHLTVVAGGRSEDEPSQLALRTRQIVNPGEGARFLKAFLRIESPVVRAAIITLVEKLRKNADNFSDRI